MNLWRENRKGQVSPDFRVGMSTRTLLSNVEKFEAETTVQRLVEDIIVPDGLLDRMKVMMSESPEEARDDVLVELAESHHA